MPVYHCTHCGFTFKREGEVTNCPDCGKPEVRLALQSEIEDLKKETEERAKE